MAVTITDLRTVYTDGDSWDANWSTGALDNSTYAEASGSIATDYSIASGDIYYQHPGGSIDLTNSLLYVYSSCNAIQLSWTTGPHCVFLGDGTDQLSLHMAGGDRDNFKHSDGPVSFQSFLIDGSQLQAKKNAGEYSVIAGDTTLDISAVTQIGGYYITQSKALGGGDNCWIDTIKYGNSGIRIAGGTTGDRGTFLEIATDDRSTADGKAYGIFREFSSGIFGCQGTLTFGNTAGASWFDDSNVTVVFEGDYIGDTKFYFKVVGDTGAGDSTNFFLNNVSITTSGPKVTCDFSSDGINQLSITNCSFNSLQNSITFAGDSGHTVTNNTFNLCGMVDPGLVNFSNNTISNTTDANGGLLIDSTGTDKMSNLTFISDGTGHAIYITESGTYTFTNFTYTGYGGGDTTNSVVYNNSGDSVTINKSGGDAPTVRNGSGASTTVVSSVPVSVTVINEDGDSVEEAQVAVYLPSGDSVMNKDTNAAGVASTTYGGSTPTSISIRVRKSSTGATRYFPNNSSGTITGSGFSSTVTLIRDTIATT